MITKAQMAAAEKSLNEYLLRHYGVKLEDATSNQLYYALARVAEWFLYEKKGAVVNDKNKDKKTLHYMSIEFLIGRNLKNNLWNVGVEGFIRDLLASKNKNLDDVYAIEKDAGLGNGGLGRLAACFLDSLARLGYPAFGHCLKYEYGLFNQKIVNGVQIETPDEWFDTGRVWLEEREDQAVEVVLGGTLNQYYTEYGLSYSYENATVLQAIPFDMLMSGYDSNTVSTLRLWEAHAKNKINLDLYDEGKYVEALRERTELEAINKMLYPADHSENGKSLRLIQQYFLVSAAMQNILNNYFKTHTDPKGIPELVSVHINDTHPVLCIPELMRLLMDKYGLGWDDSWEIVKKTVSYTNHTILSEALEVKRLNAIEKIMPRIAMILRELDKRFRNDLNEFFKNDFRRVESMAIISGNNVYMANLAIYASYAVNGVSKIHSQILKTRLFRDYAEMYPGRFKNITNGITHRRWLAQSNPKLDELVCSLIGDEYYTKPELLIGLSKYENDKEVLNKLAEIKFENKKKFAEYLFKKQGIQIDPNARFDVQVKRIHEYKRQLMNVLKIIYLCNQIRQNPDEYVTPQVFIFAGKAASGYYMAKRIIKLINELSNEVNNDPLLSSKIKVVFAENYNVSMAEILMPATEVSEQISLAGREASGTGNMKAVLNGALMLCTIDGANIEISDHCGHETQFEFGLVADEVEKIKNRGYNAMEYYIASEKVRSVIDKLNTGVGNEVFSDIADYLLGHSDHKDSYMCLADLDSYIEAHYKMDKAYADKELWNKNSLKAISKMGYFSSDRSIEDYVEKIWGLKKNED